MVPLAIFPDVTLLSWSAAVSTAPSASARADTAPVASLGSVTHPSIRWIVLMELGGRDEGAAAIQSVPFQILIVPGGIDVSNQIAPMGSGSPVTVNSGGVGP